MKNHVIERPANQIELEMECTCTSHKWKFMETVKRPAAG
jgi:hypothetical protein